MSVSPGPVEKYGKSSKLTVNRPDETWHEEVSVKAPTVDVLPYFGNAEFEAVGNVSY